LIYDSILVMVNLEDYDSEYEEFKKDFKKEKAKVKKIRQKWGKIATINDTYLEKYLDHLIRDKTWLYKVLYTKENYLVLKCDEGVNCQYKRRVHWEEVQSNLSQDDALYEISKASFGGVLHKLEIEENSENHTGHFPSSELDEKSKGRTAGCSEFAKILIKNMKLHHEKQIKRIDDLKKLFGNDYSKHITNSHSLSSYCAYLRNQEFLKDFNNSIGNFRELQQLYTFEKAKEDSDLIILGINEDLENFTLVFTCQHFLQHIIKQQETRQPSFLCSDTTFSLLRNNYKLIIIGK